MSWGQALSVDPAHVRELVEARAERFERAREARERFGEPVVSLRPCAPHAACGWRLAETVEECGRRGLRESRCFRITMKLEFRAERKITSRFDLEMK